MQFKPERFDEKIKNSADRPYLPFGEGPRICIGLRMGKLQTKIGLIHMLKDHRFKLSPNLVGKDLRFNPASFVPVSVDDLDLIASPR